MTTKTATLTTADLDRMTSDDRWLGWGFIGERQRAADTTDRECIVRKDVRAEVDRAVLTEANARGWTYDQLFEWANSKLGRWVGDSTYGSVSQAANVPAAFARCIDWGYFRLGF